MSIIFTTPKLRGSLQRITHCDDLGQETLIIMYIPILNHTPRMQNEHQQWISRRSPLSSYLSRSPG